MRQQSDTDFISNTRRLITFWDRWLHFVTVFGTIILLWSFWYLNATWQAFTAVDADDQLFLEKLNHSWMFISLLVGITLGANFAGLLSYMAKSIFGGYRAERVLLKLHAELESVRDGQNAG